jgi:hypothetical protein
MLKEQQELNMKKQMRIEAEK